MPQIEGLYVVDFGDVAIGGQTYTYWNGGVAVLETNRIFGGDSGYYYLGNYTIKDSQFESDRKDRQAQSNLGGCLRQYQPILQCQSASNGQQGHHRGICGPGRSNSDSAHDPPDMRFQERGHAAYGDPAQPERAWRDSRR